MPRHYPIYVVRLPSNEGCGHQHSNRKAAWSCAENIAMKRKNLAWIEVYRLSRRGDNIREQRIGRVAQYSTCPECKGLTLTMEDGEVRGHYEDCPILVVTA